MFSASFISSLRAPWLPAVALLGAAWLLLPNANAQANAQAQPALGLEQALQAAQARSRQLVAHGAAASAAREMAHAAGQLPDPVLKAGINDLPVNGPDRFSLTQDFMTQRSIGFAQEFTRADKRQARERRFEREADAANASHALALANLRRDTAVAWLERHNQERMLGILRAQRAEASLQVEAAEAVYRGGRGAQADVFAARTAVAQIDDRILQTERLVDTANTRLARWIGNASNQPLGAPPDLSALPVDAARLEAQLERQPELVLLARQLDVARAEADIAQSSKKADWSAELMYSQRGPAYSNMVSINFSVPLQVDSANRQDREVAAKLALADHARAQLEEATRERLAETRTWLQEWQSNRARLTQYDSALIPLASERTRAALAAYRGGAGPLSAVLEARRMEIDTRADRLRLETETATLWAQLEYLIPPEHAAVAAAPEQP